MRNSAISVKKIEQDRLDQERQTAANNLANTQAQADDASRQRDDATRMKEQAQSDQARSELAKRAAESDAAKARNDAGTGTQLDVLAAQTSLTQARSTQIEALHDYDVTRARLERAMGINIMQTTQK